MEGSIPPSRRRAPACVPCRQRKLRCDRKLPCGMCVRSRKEECFYSQPQAAQAAQIQIQTQMRTQTQLATTLTGPSIPPFNTLVTDVDAISGHGHASPPKPSPTGARADVPPDSPKAESVSSSADEQWLNSTMGSVLISGKPQEPTRRTPSTGSSPTTAISRRSGRRAGDSDERTQRKPSATPQVCDQWLVSLNEISRPIKGIMFKGRYFGPSHWLQAMALVPSTLTWVHKTPYKAGNEQSRLLADCSTLAKHIKSQRQPKPWSGECGKQFPSRQVSDRLLDLYIRCFEPIYRVAHVPSLISSYRSFWEAPDATDSLVVHKIQLCLALGCYVYDDAFSLRSFVVQWMHEAKVAMVMLERSPMRLECLQLLCLLHLVRRYYQGKQGPPLWISAGTLYQAGVMMGLHIAPSKLPRVSSYHAEMRRRLWCTILEFQVESSIEGGTMPLMLLDDTAHDLPSNLDDDQIDPDVDTSPTPEPRDSFTNTSLQLALARSLPLRAAVIKIVNDTNHQASYGAILRLTAELQEANRVLSAQIASYGPRLNPFLVRWCDSFIRRYFLILHIPYMQLAARNPLYYFSRKVCIDNAIRLSYAFCPPGDAGGTLEGLRLAANIDKPCVDFLRYNYCTIGHARSTHFQCCSIIAAELLSILREESRGNSQQTGDGVGVIGNLQYVQLHALLVQAHKLAESRIRAGNTNVKDFVHTAVFLAEVEAYTSGSAMAPLVHTRATESINQAIAILRDQVTEETMMGGMAMQTLDTAMYPDEMGQLSTFWMGEFQDVSWDNFNPGMMHR